MVKCSSFGVKGYDVSLVNFMGKKKKKKKKGRKGERE